MAEPPNAANVSLLDVGNERLRNCYPGASPAA
jgi:hypothetical protein